MNTHNQEPNTDPRTGIHYGVIPLNLLNMDFMDDTKHIYPDPEEVLCPHCGAPEVHVVKAIDGKLKTIEDKPQWGNAMLCSNCGTPFDLDMPEMMEPIGWTYEKDGYELTSGVDVSVVMVLKSPYVAQVRYCSPCYPGAGDLTASDRCHGIWTYCLGSDFFENEMAPYVMTSLLAWCMGQVGLCPICGENVSIRELTKDSRLVGSCGDAFTMTQWFQEE